MEKFQRGIRRSKIPAVEIGRLHALTLGTAPRTTPAEVLSVIAMLRQLSGCFGARSPTSPKKATSVAIGWLPARPTPQPVECHGLILGIPQPFRDFLCLECAILRVKFMIEQLSNFFDRARFPDFVQCSRDVLVERASRI